MEQANHETGETRIPVPVIPPDEETLDIIRTETVFSRLPVHNLAKKGRVNIEILKTTPTGEIEMKWEVSHSDRYGQARQLAYKLDTIVIDQKIDQLGKPLPQRICLGSLNEIASELGSMVDHGTTNQHIKRALRQDALLGITAKFKYRANDGSEKTLEATFTRYNVIFTGEKFSDGTRADAVFIELNPIYREVLNNAPTRPLDFGYKKILPPAAQRFYEIVSYKIFSALKNKHPFARLPYSEYCTCSPQQRYFDYDHFKKQMYKVHQPHLKSGYLEKVRYEMTVDEKGKPDWIICYVPGLKARSEFAAVHRGKKFPVIEAGETQHPRIARPRQRRLKLQLTPPEPSAQISAAAVVADQQLISVFDDYGITEKKARELLANLKPGQTREKVLAQLELGRDTYYKAPLGKFNSSTGLFVSFVRDDVPIPKDFETKAQREAREERERERAREESARLELENAYDAYCRNETDRYLASVDPAEYDAVLKAKLVESRKNHDRSPWLADSFAKNETRHEFANRAPLMTLAEFKARREQGTAPPAEPALELANAAFSAEESPNTEGIPPIMDVATRPTPSSQNSENPETSVASQEPNAITADPSAPSERGEPLHNQDSGSSPLPEHGESELQPEASLPPPISEPIIQLAAATLLEPAPADLSPAVPPLDSAPATAAATDPTPSNPASQAEPAPANPGSQPVSGLPEPTDPEPDEAEGWDLHPHLL